MKKNKKVIFLIIMIVVFLVFLVLGQSTFAKYKTTISGEGKAEIAKPFIVLEGGDSVLIDGVNKTGIYHFTVKNYNQENINEVELKYKLKIISDTDNSISYTLYKDDEQISLTNNASEEITMPHSESTIHEYKLEVKYDNTKSEQASDIVEDVELELDAIQSKL